MSVWVVRRPSTLLAWTEQGDASDNLFSYQPCIQAPLAVTILYHFDLAWMLQDQCPPPSPPQHTLHFLTHFSTDQDKNWHNDEAVLQWRVLSWFEWNLSCCLDLLVYWISWTFHLLRFLFKRERYLGDFEGKNNVGSSLNTYRPFSFKLCKTTDIIKLYVLIPVFIIYPSFKVICRREVKCTSALIMFCKIFSLFS